MEAIYGQLADLLEVESVTSNDVLEDFECWDSLTILSIIALASEKYGVVLTNDIIRTFSTIGDLTDYLKEHRA